MPIFSRTHVPIIPRSNGKYFSFNTLQSLCFLTSFLWQQVVLTSSQKFLLFEADLKMYDSKLNIEGLITINWGEKKNSLFTSKYFCSSSMFTYLKIQCTLPSFPFPFQAMPRLRRADPIPGVTACCWTSWRATSHSCHCYPPSAQGQTQLSHVPSRLLLQCWLSSTDKAARDPRDHSSPLWSTLSQTGPEGSLEFLPVSAVLASWLADKFQKRVDRL